MATVNGKSGTFNIYTENQYINGYVKWQETYDDSTYISTNKSKVTIKAYLHRTNIYNDVTYITNIAGQRIAYFGSETVVDNSNITLSIAGTTSSGGGAYTKVFEASKEITHDSNGAKSLDLGFYMTNVESGAGANAFKVAKTTSKATLTTIPRYATSNQSVNSKTETSITMNWSSDNTIDYIWYSTDWGTNWVEVGSTNGTSGSYTITKSTNDGGNLIANTTYNVITRVRRKDSQLTTNSEKLSVTTYDYPHITNVGTTNLTIGDSQTLTLYNPLSRSVTVRMFKDSTSGTQLYGGNTSGTSITFTPTASNLYASIPNAQSGSCVYTIVYGSVSTRTTTGSYTYKIKGTEKPTLGTITYADTNSTVTAITGDSSKIVQNQSNLKVTFTSATALNSATISKHSFVLNGVTKENTSASGSVDFGKVNSANDLTLTITVTDSRGLTASTTKTITMLAHSNPTAIVTLERLNNYEDETYLTVDGSISSVNSKNQMTIQYRYKLSGGSYGSFTTISDNTKKTLSLDKNNSYMFNIVVTDSFGAKYDKEHPLGKGVFPLFIDTEKNAVGINTFPTSNESLKVAGGNINLEDTGTNVGFQQGGNTILRNNGSGVTIVSGSGDSVLLRPKGSTDSSAQFKISSSGVISLNEVSIISSGSNSNGNYVKLYDGTLIQWNYMEVTDQAITSAYGTLYQGTRTITYPVAFVGNTPVLTCSMFKWGSSASWGTTTENDTPLTKGTLRGLDGYSRATGTTCRIAWTAIGKWK